MTLLRSQGPQCDTGLWLETEGQGLGCRTEGGGPRPTAYLFGGDAYTETRDPGPGKRGSSRRRHAEPDIRPLDAPPRDPTPFPPSPAWGAGRG